MTDEEVIKELQSDSYLNRARATFAGEMGRIEQAGQQIGRSLTPIEMRRMEFHAVRMIADALGLP